MIKNKNRVTYTFTEYSSDTCKHDRHEIEGNFSHYGCAFTEFDTGAGNYSTAIIINDDGTVKNVPVENVRFINHEK